MWLPLVIRPCIFRPWWAVLPGMEALATTMMKKEMTKVDMPEVEEFLDILYAWCPNSGPANWRWTCSTSEKKTSTKA